MGEGKIHMSIRKQEIQTVNTIEGLNLVETDTILAFPALISKTEYQYDKILWIDSRNSAKTHYFEKRPNLLEKVSIARAFTALQHHRICKEYADRYDLVVAPSIDHLYANSSLYKSEAVKLFEDVCNSLEHKELIFSVDNNIGLKLKELAENIIKVERTELGLKYSDKETITQSYFDKGLIQTTVKSYEEVEKWGELIKPTETV